MTKAHRFIVLLSFLVLSFFLLNVIDNKKNTSSNTKIVNENKSVSEHYEIKAIPIPNELNFAGERVPIEKNDIKERLDRELLVNTYWQSNGLLLLKRANKFFPIIESLLKKHGLPDDFKYLCVAESGLINIPSYKGAAGYWHFLPSTGKEFGLEINNNIDERYNLEKSTAVAAAYLKKSKDKFGSWTLAAAAYNAGNGKINQRLTEQQVNNYYDLLLNHETSRYVFRILALKEIMTHPKKYGFVFNKKDLYNYPKTKEINVNYAIPNLASFAQKHGVTYKELKLINPWLRQTKLNNKTNKNYTIKIPLTSE